MKAASHDLMDKCGMWRIFCFSLAVDRSLAAAYHSHAVELRDRGFTVIRNAGIDQTLVTDARWSCATEFSRLTEMVEQLGLDPIEDNYAFNEIDKRHRLRWNLQTESDTSAWARLIAAAVPTAASVIKHIHQSLPPNPNDDDEMAWARQLVPSHPEQASYGAGKVGAILSRPGAQAQKFHADAGDLHLSLARRCTRHRLYNMFVPMVDLAEDGDGTMMWPGSHLHRTRANAYHEAIGRSGRLEDDEQAMAEMEVPGCPAGGIILFDSRLIHRGMPNDTDRERILAHTFLSTGLAFDRSTPPGSLREAVDELPECPVELRKQRESAADLQRQAWLTLRASSAR